MVLKVVFTDLDGTLVHYASHNDNGMRVVRQDPLTHRAVLLDASTHATAECVSLPSMTSGTGFISLGTFSRIARLRSLGVRVVIITGARTSTYLQRRLHLPPVDFEVYENGGKILLGGSEPLLDTQWLQTMQYCFPEIMQGSESPDGLIPSLDVARRTGSLWDCYRKLAELGWQVDARDYWTGFRITVPNHRVQEWAQNIVPTLEPLGLKSAFNLGKADVFPAVSGKRNAAEYIMKKLNVQADECIALFDDDNDIEMGFACGKAVLPGVMHPNVLQILNQPQMKDKWIVTKSKGVFGAEEALDLVIQWKLSESSSKL